VVITTKFNEMRFLRLVAGYRRIDKKKNIDIRQDLKILNLREKIKAYQQSYFEHILRMPECLGKYSATTLKEEAIEVDHQ
jgi:hypothetical protein